MGASVSPVAVIVEDEWTMVDRVPPPQYLPRPINASTTRRPTSDIFAEPLDLNHESAPPHAGH
jgi:hypothetical protein